MLSQTDASPLFSHYLHPDSQKKRTKNSKTDRMTWWTSPFGGPNFKWTKNDRLIFYWQRWAYGTLPSGVQRKYETTVPWKLSRTYDRLRIGQGKIANSWASKMAKGGTLGTRKGWGVSHLGPGRILLGLHAEFYLGIGAKFHSCPGPNHIQAQGKITFGSGAKLHSDPRPNLI